MKTRISIILLLILPLFVFAQAGKNFIDMAYIEVTGKADMEVVPDEIYIQIRINELDNKGKKSLEKLEKDMMKVLTKIGIDLEENLSIVDFSSNFRQHLLRKSSILTSKEYQLLVHDGQTTGKVFIELEKVGISNISIEKVGHSKIEELQMKVKVKAIKAAKEKATFLAEGIDQTIGNALYIQEMGNGYYPRVQRAGNIMMKSFAEADMTEAIPEIEFEKIKLEYSILAKFELKSQLKQ
ncbi:MAG: SIMPL domain-containing protein [Bacteroidales bacterium]|nr:SIMPL domain-containing protein [Bacteroidales bacterium]